MPITLADKIKTLMREVEFRRRVYLNVWVPKGRITQHVADREIAIMEAILADYDEKCCE
jgi:predicted ATPase